MVEVDGPTGRYTVLCRFRDEKGFCTGRYEGYSCIEDRCPFYRMILDGRCGYLRDGGYCTYYKRFHCPGLGKCDVTFGMKIVRE